MNPDTDAIVACPNCNQEAPLGDIPTDNTCPNCGQTIPRDAPAKIRREAADGNLDKVIGDDYSPIGGAEKSQDEITKPKRDIETITDQLAAIEKGDVVEMTIGAREEQAKIKLYAISHERNVVGFNHRVSFVSTPQDDGWTRLYITGNGRGNFDAWKVVSAPYDVGGDGTADMRDFAAHGWLINIETTEKENG